MKINGKSTRFAYNAQLVADEKEGVLVGLAVMNAISNVSHTSQSIADGADVFN